MFEHQTEERRACATPLAVMVTVAFFGIFGLPLYLTGATLGGAVVYFSRRRVAWKAWEAYILVIPTIAYFIGLLLAPPPSKGLFQPPLELFLLGFGVPLMLATRVLRGRDREAWPLTAWLIAWLSVVALAAGALIPRMMPPD